MSIVNGLRLYISLFFYINKNYFYEKFKFLSTSYKTDKILYGIWYFTKGYATLFLSMFLVTYVIKVPSLNIFIVLIPLLSILLKIDNKDWKLFNRNDFIIEIPNEKERFRVILFGNMFINLICEKNIIVLLVILGEVSNFRAYQIAVLIIMYLITYIAILSACFMIQIGDVKIKRLFSCFSYIFEMTTITIVVYCIIDFFIKLFITFSLELKSKNIIPSLFENIINSLNRVGNLIVDKGIYLIIGVFIFDIITIFITLTILKNMDSKYNNKEGYQYRVNNFYLLSLVRKIAFKFLNLDNFNKAMIDKEFSLFASIYKFNFKDYFYIFILDRSFGFLMAVMLIFLKYPFNNYYVVMLILSAMLLITDINSATGVKMIVNLSFIADYNTLITANTYGLKINKLLKTKILFFYIMKAFSYVLLVGIISVFSLMLGAPIWFIILLILELILIIVFMPKVYITNNLIYTRMNYKNYDKYLDETKILEYGINEFYPLNLMFRILSLVLIFTIIILLLFKKLSILIVIINICAVEIFTIAFTYLVMERIRNNILEFVERGNYSADFTKIFKKSNNKK
ncbi:hypothetical protein [Caproiciproducens sp. MSJ-32]|uniref:hypothetical protein n=1 Tax=Caproiciproducens sp. MSJ-32 TaxID=2841527 RepID=UPI001C123D6B|nr:hypothetical protein [Caproiciproducens sp. MSJ-32]MBU5455241.1 hypothetical protein [Caproiciproducens sp. MSJ-32]